MPAPGGFLRQGFTPPAWRNHRNATGDDTPATVAASSVFVPRAIAAQKRTRSCRHAGGVNPFLAPTVSGRYLSFGEREEIALVLGPRAIGVREIARRLGRSPSTISRELGGNASTRTWRLEFKATVAQWHAERCARRSKAAEPASNDRLRGYVQDRLAGRVRATDGRVLDPEGPQWNGKNKPHRGDRR